MYKFLTLFFSLLMFAGVCAQTPDPNFHIYLCIGQSNMEGNATPEAVDKNNVPERFQMMAAVNFNSPSRRKGEWYKAVPPLVRQGTGLTPADWFGRTMVDNLPEDVKVGVLMVAIGGCKIEDLDKDFDAEKRLASEADWFKNYMKAYDNYPYGRLIECAKKAQQDGVIKGILLHQGCSNNGDAKWCEKVKKIYQDILSDLDLKAEDVPLLAGELVTEEMGGYCWGHNSIIQTLPQTIPTAHVISAENCPCKGDGLHFSAHGYRVLGCRYATKMLRLQGIYHPKVAYSEQETIDITTAPTEWDKKMDFTNFIGAIKGEGTFSIRHSRNTFVPGKNCIGGWEFLETPLDLSGYKYLIAEITDTQSANLKLQLWDTENIDDVPYSLDFGKGKVVIAELSGMMKNLPEGIETFETSHIYRLAFRADGDGKTSIKIKHVFATNIDPYDPNAALGIEPISELPKSDGAVYNLQGVRVSGQPKSGIYVKDGKKVLY